MTIAELSRSPRTESITAVRVRLMIWTNEPTVMRTIITIKMIVRSRALRISSSIQDPGNIELNIKQ
jgi:hypothetical protein